MCTMGNGNKKVPMIILCVSSGHVPWDEYLELAMCYQTNVLTCMFTIENVILYIN